MAHEQLEAGNGVGVILSPRDLKLSNAAAYAKAYHDLGAAVLCDQQFYLPEFSNDRLESYPISAHRASASDLIKMDVTQLANLRDGLRQVSEALGVDGILAPAVIYQAGRPDLWGLNARLLSAARDVGIAMGKPTYATVVIGRSATSSDQTLDAVMEHVTGLASEGWYFGFEFEPERVPSDLSATNRCCKAIMTLACTGRPVMHAFAGMMAPLSIAAGAAAAAIGHSQNLWRFSPERWQPSDGDGGGGGAPPRFFSRALWGTIVHPDELAQLNPGLRTRVVTPSAFSGPVTANTAQPWSRWDAHKHLLALIGAEVGRLSGLTPKAAASEVVQLLAAAVQLHADIRQQAQIVLTDQTSLYQDNWRAAMSQLLRDNAGDYAYLEML